MKKIRVDQDEWYPIYYISDDYGKEVEIPEKTLTRFRRVFKEFNSVQVELGKLVHKEHGE